MLFKIKAILEKTSIQKLLLLALMLRLSWFLFIFITNPEGFWLYDSYGYWNIAYNLKEYATYSMDFEPPLTLDCFRTPLYPFLIYPTTFFDEYGYSIPVIQILLDCLTAYFIYRVLLQVTGNTAYAKGGLLIYALHLPAIVMTNFVISESTLACCLMFFIWRMVLLIQFFNLRNAMLCGLAAGLAVLCKPVAFALVLPVLFAIFAIYKLNLRSLKLAGFFLFIFYSVQFPWMQRNKTQFDHYFNSVLGEHLILSYHASHVLALAQQRPFHEVQEELRFKFMDHLDYNPYEKAWEYAKLVEKESYSILWNNKWIFLKEHLKECIKFFIQPIKGYVASQIGYKKSYARFLTYTLVGIQILAMGSLYILILVAVFKNLFKTLHLPWTFFFLLGLLLLFCNFNTMPYTDARIRFPFDPAIILLACIAVYNLRQKRGWHVTINP